MLSTFSCFCCRLFSILPFQDVLSGTLIESQTFLDPDQDRRSVGPDLDPNCLQRLSTDDKVNAYICILVSEKFLQKTTILLVCDGLDTVSVVYINDKEVGRSVNMFVRYIFDVKHALHVSIVCAR